MSAKTVCSLQEWKITHLKSYYHKSPHATCNETQILTDLKLYARKGDNLQVTGMETYTHQTFGNLHTSSLWKFTHIKSITISHHMQPAMRHKPSLTSNCTQGKETACKLLEWKLTHIKPLETYTHQASGNLHTPSLWTLAHIKSIIISHHMQPTMRHKSTPTSNCTWGKETACKYWNGNLHTSSLWKLTLILLPKVTTCNL